MLEIPESSTVGNQAAKALTHKKVSFVNPGNSPHKFAFFSTDPFEYNKSLAGTTIRTARGHGMFVDLIFDEGSFLTVGDGTHMQYYRASDPKPERYQMMIGFGDGSCLVFTVAMYGGIWLYKDHFDNPYHQKSLKSISPLAVEFDEPYFDNILKSSGKDLSLKALLATGQRIPGLGNGVLQDILFQAELHPKRKLSTLSDSTRTGLFHSLKSTLRIMTEQGGRDTEKDLFGKNGGYKTILSKNTLQNPCPRCGQGIRKESYLGGAIYFCPACQVG